MLGNIIPFPLTSGRMRYAPTPVRLIFGIYRFACRFRFRSFEGVCDSPLHMFDGKRIWDGLNVCPDGLKIIRGQLSRGALLKLI